MDIRRWTKRMAILDLVLLGLLLFSYAGAGSRTGAGVEVDDAIGVMSTTGAPTARQATDEAKKPQIDEKKIALTFDDGPHPYYTEQLLDGLEKRGVKATFFVTGEHAKLHPEIISRMSEEGHVIGNHTYSHIKLNKNNREKFKEELVATNEVIKEITGEGVSYVRPPYGIWDKKLEKELSMIPVMWTVDPLDWCSDNADCITQKVLEKAKENDIILMHDYYKSSVTAALAVIDELQEKGYVFVTVDEILFD